MIVICEKGKVKPLVKVNMVKVAKIIHSSLYLKTKTSFIPGLCKARANDTFKFKKTTKACQYSSIT